MFKFASYGSSSSGNCHILNCDLMLDAGVSLRTLRAQGVLISGLVGCLVSHEHKDHSKAIPKLMESACEVYVSPETKDALNLFGHRCHTFEPLRDFSVGDYEVKSFPLVHDVPNYGFFIKQNEDRMVYITDTAYCNYTFAGLTLIAIECNYSEETFISNTEAVARQKRVAKTHFGLRNVIKFLSVNDLSNLQGVHLLHLSDANSDEEFIRSEIRKIVGCPVYVAKA